MPAPAVNSTIDAPSLGAVFLADGSPQTWTNQPLAATEFRGFTHNRVRVNLADVTDAKLSVYVDGTAAITGATLYVEYTTTLTGGSGWAALAASGALSCPIDATGGNQTAAWTAIATLAKADVLLRLVGVGGDGARDPIFGNITLWVR